MQQNAVHLRNSILPEISCWNQILILAERKIAGGVSERVNWVAMSFNKMETTIFAFGDNRDLQCNARIVNRETVGRSTRKRKRKIGREKRVPTKSISAISHRHWNSMLSGLQSWNIKCLITRIIDCEIRASNDVSSIKLRELCTNILLLHFNIISNPLRLKALR